MALEKKLFPAQEASEKVLRIIRKHWFSYLIFWAIAIFMSLPLIALVIYSFSYGNTINPIWLNVFILAGSAYSLFILALIIYGFIDFYLDVYIVTDRRIVDITQNGFFKRTISELNLRQIQDVNAQVNGFAATLFHFGNVHIQTAGEMPNFVFEQIPHPYEVSKKILDLHEAYVQKKENESEGRIKKGFQSVVDDLPSFNDFPENETQQKILEGIERNKREIEVGNYQKDKEGQLKEGEKVDITDLSH